VSEIKKFEITEELIDECLEDALDKHNNEE
jgi:hypothetical protein